MSCRTKQYDYPRAYETAQQSTETMSVGSNKQTAKILQYDSIVIEDYTLGPWHICANDSVPGSHNREELRELYKKSSYSRPTKIKMYGVKSASLQTDKKDTAVSKSVAIQQQPISTQKINKKPSKKGTDIIIIIAIIIALIIAGWRCWKIAVQ